MPTAAPHRPALTAPRRALEQPDYQALAAFRHALRVFVEFSEGAARAAGLTPQQHQALLAIKGTAGPDGLSVGELAEHLLIRPHSAAELVNRLNHAGLVRRASDPADRRRVLLHLTPEAEHILHELSATHVEELHRIRPALERLIARFGDDAHADKPLR